MIFKNADLLKEACDPKDLCGGSDIDQQLSEKDLVKEFEKICPICPTDEAAIIEACANPAAVKVISVNDKFFVEASDLYKYMEYAGITNEAAALNEIIRCNEAEAPEMDKDSLVLVLPSDNDFASVSESVANNMANRIQTMMECGITMMKRNPGEESIMELSIRRPNAETLAKDLVKHSKADKEKCEEKYTTVLKSGNINKLEMLKKQVEASLELFDSKTMEALKNFSAEERKPVTAYHNFLKSTLTKVDKEIAKIKKQK